jgi:hypothetical protein
VRAFGGLAEPPGHAARLRRGKREPCRGAPACACGEEGRAMKSNAQKGQYYKTRTKAWMERDGFEVAFMERMAWLRTKPKDDEVTRLCLEHGVTPPPGMVPTKTDQLGADLLGVRQQPEALVFVQVKSRSQDVPEGVRGLLEHRYPSYATLWVVYWEFKAREPVVVDARKYMEERERAMPNRPRRLTVAPRLPLRGDAMGSLFDQPIPAPQAEPGPSVSNRHRTDEF